ncbi:uncharacterized protein YecE (DUF72 family) [Novosphingobium chloroacetimidivorans]|uniref:Uncharacterized protein YecE (DUF72 family) n=1 Tax=Novosphingobium chloroacetimidivorans TaxID=1428314 RepID=A0A7W7NVV7_9SPHN|nr:DUF72 domain-containing protein [Novosphingobium chloroacetimidivorans]MBB4857495.1 uncharacterized protein YecE (DUF72 family) [Novosphingobium chloroacetimidivorans]
MSKGAIRIGVGGWVYQPWRDNFYPAGLAHTRELAYLGAHLTATEINATAYRLQKPATFAKWRDTVPGSFRFALKGSNYCTNRKNLAEAGESVAKFVGQGLVELGERLGPINWQLRDTKRFDPDEIEAFLALLPKSHEGVTLRHAIEPRHESFDDPAFYALAKAAGVAVVVSESEKFADFAAADGPFVYARLQRCRPEEATGYPPPELAAWADRARGWAKNGREVYAFFIAGAKERAPAAAQALIAALAGDAVQPAEC